METKASGVSCVSDDARKSKRSEFEINYTCSRQAMAVSYLSVTFSRGRLRRGSDGRLSQGSVFLRTRSSGESSRLEDALAAMLRSARRRAVDIASRNKSERFRSSKDSIAAASLRLMVRANNKEMNWKRLANSLWTARRVCHTWSP